MRVAQINSVCGVGSTGRICLDVSRELDKKGIESVIFYGRGAHSAASEKYARKMGGKCGVYAHALLSRAFDSAGLHSKAATKRLIRALIDFNPDIIHLHNLHGYYLNIEILFDYLKKCGKKIFWTLHDCWSFTGHCANFDMVGCDGWKTGCTSCKYKREYPTSYLFSRSKRNYLRKKEAFSGVPDMTLITPSNWLAGLVEKTFMNRYPVVVIRNGIDTSVFKPTEGDVRAKYGIPDKKIVLGVANYWSENKGFSDFLKLREILDEKFEIVLVGMDDKRAKILPKGVTGVKRTDSANDLAALYTASSVFVNPTYEDNYPTVNLEAQACGTAVITYKTGGSPESVPIQNAVEKGDIEGLKKLIESENNPLFPDMRFGKEEMIEKYLQLYGE